MKCLTHKIENFNFILFYRTILTDEEIKIFMGLLLHPNRICIGKAIALTKYKLQQQGQSFIPTDATFRRYANWFKNNNYDKWILARDIKKLYLEYKSRNLPPKTIRNNLSLLNQIIKYYQSLDVIDRKYVFQVKRLTKKNQFDESRIIF